MVYKTPFLKKRVVSDYDPSADEVHTFDLSDEALGALWISIKGDLVQADECLDDLCKSLTSIDVNMGGFNVVHYANTQSAVMMNALLKRNRPMLIGNGVAIDDIKDITFPILFGAPYLNRNMALPASHSNRKQLILGLDIATSDYDDLLIDVHEVILPDAHPLGALKQEEISQSAIGTGDKDVWLQTNWDLLYVLFKGTTVPADATWTSTVERAGLELNDFFFGYNNVTWETLHAELMDRIGGEMGMENHFHADPSSGVTGFPEDFESWASLFAGMDFFFNDDLQWKVPNSGASTCKLKLNLGVDEAFYYTTVSYVPATQL